MATSGLDSTRAQNILSALIGKASLTAFSTAAAAKLKLITSTGTTSETGDGTEVSGGSYPAGGIPMTISTTFGAATYSTGTASITNSLAAVTQTGMPTVGSPGVSYVSIYDGAGTPLRWWWGALTTAVITNSGDTLTFATSSITLQMNV